MKNVNTSHRFYCLLVVCIALLTISNYSQAATINVTANATDTLNGTDGQCSLREAITNINDAATTYADCAPTGAYGTGDAINIPVGTYITIIAGTGEELNATGDYDILKSVAIVGAGQASTIIDGGGIDRVFHIVGNYTVSFTGVTIQNGLLTSDWGGGILNAASGSISVTNSTIKNNSVPAGGGGGGIAMTTGTYSGNGTLTVTDSTITGNNAGGAGGGIYTQGTVSVTNSTIINNTVQNGSGGGIMTNSGSTTITDSTISINSAQGAGGTGGGIHLQGGVVAVVRSTVSGNSATYKGGGIAGWNGTRFSVSNSTISGNSAPDGGGIVAYLNSTVTNSTIVKNSATTVGGGGGFTSLAGGGTYTNTIIADNGTGGDCALIGGFITNSGGNIDSDSTCTGFIHSAAMVQGTGFSALAGNGGPTQTHALLTGSAAIDAAPTCAGLSVDQRGTTRPQGSKCDTGAYEVVVVSVPPATPPPVTPVTPVTSIAPTTGSGGGCFIATAAYGSYLHPQVKLLRNFRDDYLLTSVPGRAFVAFYYRCSPPLADIIARHPILRALTRLALTPLFVVIAHPVVSALALVLLIGAVLVSFRRRVDGCATKVCGQSSGRTT